MSEHGWVISSSEEEEDETSLLPPMTKFESPQNIKRKLLSDKRSPLAQNSNVKLHFREISPVNKEKAECPYGEKCYRKNPAHFNEFSHPKKRKVLDCDKDQSTPKKINLNKVGNSSKMNSKSPVEVWESSAPYFFFLTTVSGIPKQFNYLSKPQKPDEIKHPPSLGIKDILSTEFGALKECALFNYCYDIEWLMSQFPDKNKTRPILLVHGEQGGSNMRIQAEAKPYPNIQLCRCDLQPYGTHHTKMMFLLYEQGLRIVIMTANFVAQDWGQKTQGFWMSPIFPSSQQNQSQFADDLISYITAYKRKPLDRWIDIIKCYDMSGANVALIASVPGRHVFSNLSKWGHMRLRKVLSSKVKRIDSSWPVIGQFSSIGSLGPSKDKWLCNEWLTSLSSCDMSNSKMRSTQPPLKLIFPSVNNIRCSLEGYPAGASVPYSSSNAAKQQWLNPFLHQWDSSHSFRSAASPHIKSYTRISPYETNIRAAWFLLTSANLSKAAWGALEKNGSQLAIKSFELGVLFLPSATNEAFLNIKTSAESKFPLPFSYPLVDYKPGDKPWTWDAKHDTAPDRHGNVWVPP